jgi:hypothetical protein
VKGEITSPAGSLHPLDHFTRRNTWQSVPSSIMSAISPIAPLLSRCGGRGSPWGQSTCLDPGALPGSGGRQGTGPRCSELFAATGDIKTVVPLIGHPVVTITQVKAVIVQGAAAFYRDAGHGVAFIVKFKHGLGLPCCGVRWRPIAAPLLL